MMVIYGFEHVTIWYVTWYLLHAAPILHEPHGYSLALLHGMSNLCMSTSTKPASSGHLPPTAIHVNVMGRTMQWF